MVFSSGAENPRRPSAIFQRAVRFLKNKLNAMEEVGRTKRQSRLDSLKIGDQVYCGRNSFQRIFGPSYFGKCTIVKFSADRSTATVERHGQSWEAHTSDFGD